VLRVVGRTVTQFFSCACTFFNIYVQKKDTQAIFFKKEKISFSSLKFKFFANTEFYIGIAILEFSLLLYNVQNLNIYMSIKRNIKICMALNLFS
jgi:hypothetical protein